MKQDIEASVIGGLLIGGLTPTASDVLATLEPEAFSIPLYRKAFEVIRKQARNRNLIDALMVAEACGEEHFTSILMTSKNCPSAANLKGYAGMVADNYHRRLVLEIMDEMREPIQSGTIDASSQAMDELVKRLSAIRKPRDEVKPVRLGEIITDYTDTLDRRLRNGEESDTLKTGIEELDAITGGMNAEDLVIIAARPGMGKTELALKIAEGVASRVIPGSDVRRGVLIFSMEMSALQIAERSIANAGRMSVSVLRNPAAMDDEGWARVANGMSQLADLDVWVSGKYRGVAKLEGNTKAKVLQVLATFAYADYCRSAATPGARCRDCHGTGRAVDIAKTEQWGRVVEKECGRCKGVGYSRMPASAAYRAVTMLIPNLTQPTWSRTVKPLYDALVVQCHKEESIADNILNAVTR
ncbi:replicative DNA helicase (Replication protein gp12) [Escherichia coli TA144]|nr:replicative DNA helicase (Replication protein gp12) [Escherichia coli TA144]